MKIGREDWNAGLFVGLGQNVTHIVVCREDETYKFVHADNSTSWRFNMRDEVGEPCPRMKYVEKHYPELFL